MAPTAPTVPPTTVPLTQTIQTLYNLLICASDHRGPQTEAAMLAETQNLHTHLVTLARAATRSSSTSASAAAAAAAASSNDAEADLLPPEVVQYVEDGRNPDIYTREFAELAQRNNQKLSGKADAFEAFARVLGREIGGAVPELRSEVRLVLGRTVPRGRELVWDPSAVVEGALADEVVKVKKEGFDAS